jgi:hypothetical protein
MKMIKRYAVEPLALRRWEDFRYVMEKLGFDEGRVLVTVPKKWIRQLLNSLGSVGDIERARFTTRLQRYKQDRMIPSGSPYDSSQTWIGNASALESVGIIDKILISEETLGSEENIAYPTPSAIDDSFFDNSREIRCANTAENLVASASILLEVSEEVILVDPYFRFDNKGCMKTLAEFAKHVSRAGRSQCISIFTSSDFAPKGSQQAVGFALRKVLPIVRDGFIIRVHLVDRENTSCGFHARYLLTTKGGIRYDKGFCSTDSAELVDISLLDQRMHAELRQAFSATSRCLSLSGTLEWIKGKSS